MAHELPNDADWSMTNTRNLQCPLKFKPISTQSSEPGDAFLELSIILGFRFM